MSRYKRSDSSNRSSRAALAQLRTWLQTNKRELAIVAMVSAMALSLGGLVAASRHASSPQPEVAVSGHQSPSPVLSLVSLPAAERSEKLAELAQGRRSPERSRARYLLAVDRLQQGQAGAALPLLNNLEKEYPALAAFVLEKRAQAYTANGDAAQASATWKALIDQYPDHPLVAEALYHLGEQDAAQQDRLLQDFPSHPRSVQLAQTRLRENPQQLPLLLLLAQHGRYVPEIETVLSRLTSEYASQLQPQDWEAIAFAYWELGQYGNAGDAYEKAPPTSLNLYRAGRGAQLGDRSADAIAAYERLIQAHPDGEETSLGLLRLARLVESDTALSYTDQIIKRFPQRAGEALLERSKILDAMNSPQSASQARQSVLSQHSDSQAAAELRWTLAEQRAEAADISGAWEMARQIADANPTSELAPEAAFWVGKWALQLEQPADAKTAFEHVLTHYPQSYYAWRSAVYLGWDVGDFTSVRQKTPELLKPAIRSVPPAGSAAVQELYQLGQDLDAWSLWQVEFTNPRQPSVAEQFTDGLMRLGVGDHLDGIFMVSTLDNREKPEDKQAIQALKQDLAYWQALYPFLFPNPIASWSQERQLNPVLVTALIRQESRFEPAIVSSAGATGLMQLMPDTADWVAQQLDLTKFDLNNPQDNVNLGTWYLDYTHEEYTDNSLFAVASYNAGPGAVAGWIDRFGFDDPDVFVEQIPYPETKGYVESVFENYWNYLRLYNPDVLKQVDRYSPRHKTQG